MNVVPGRGTRPTGLCRRSDAPGAFMAIVALAVVLGGVAPLAAGRAAAAPPARCTMTTSSLRQGSKSSDVTCLESRLIQLGYQLVGPDTSFGTSTTRAVKAYQGSNSLFVDGNVGPLTRASLGLASTGVAATTLPTPPPLVDAVPAAVIETRVVGVSVEGRDITAHRMGTPGGKVVLVIGVIHGNEQKGGEITRWLRTMATPKGIDLWLIDSINPDGVAKNQRENANLVDLNRNFETKWSYIAKSSEHHQYSGEAPADQPETVAAQAFIRQIQPAVVIWYHQDANTITINGADKVIPRTYADYVGLKPGNVPCSQRCTGTASTFANSTVNGATSFLVELPGSSSVTAEMIRRHANAVLAVVTL